MGVRDPRGQVVTDSGVMVREASAYFKAFFEEREVEEQVEAFFLGTGWEVGPCRVCPCRIGGTASSEGAGVFAQGDG